MKNNSYMCHVPYLRNRAYDHDFWYTCVKWWYLQQIYFHFFKILIFRVFQSSSINVKRKFWGVSHHLYMCVIFFSASLPNPFRNFICNIMLLVELQDCYIHTCQILFQMFHFSIASYQFPSMSSKWVNMSASREVDRQDDTLT